MCVVHRTLFLHVRHMHIPTIFCNGLNMLVPVDTSHCSDLVFVSTGLGVFVESKGFVCEGRVSCNRRTSVLLFWQARSKFVSVFLHVQKTPACCGVFDK